MIKITITRMNGPTTTINNRGLSEAIEWLDTHAHRYGLGNEINVYNEETKERYIYRGGKLHVSQ